MKINLKKEFFGDREFELLTYGDMKVTAFKYSTGIEAVKVQNKRGYFILLPFKGQQIWRAEFDNQPLVMKTSFEEPFPTLEYLKTYGAFLVHCGICGMGVASSPEDTHPQHGEIPNVEYQKAYIIADEDENGKYISVCGEYDYNVSFVKHYVFNPQCKLYENDTVLYVDSELTNMRSTPMEYMYLCHINFHPVDGSELVYSAKYDKENIKVFKIIGDNVPEEQAKKLADFMDKVQENPALHHKVGAEGECYDPEICFAINYDGDENGMAYTMQKLPDGRAFYVSHDTKTMPVGIRWISRGLDEDSMGMVLPATAEHLGYTKAKKAGMVKTIEGKGKITFSVVAGLIEKDCADKVESKINEITK